MDRARARSMSVQEANDLIVSTLNDPNSRTKRSWQPGEFCRVPGVDGLLHNVCIEAFDAAGLAVVRFVEHESHTDHIPLQYLVPNANPNDVSSWTALDVCDWLKGKGPPVSYAVSYFRANGVDGGRLLNLNKGLLDRMGVPEHLLTPVMKEILRLPTGGAKRKYSFPPPSYVPSPRYDGGPPSPEFRRRSEFAEADPGMEMNSLGAARRESSAANAHDFDPLMREGMPNSHLSEEQRRARLKKGVFERIDDVKPIEDPDHADAEADVKRHLFLKGKVQRQKNRLTNRLTLYRTEKGIVKEQARHMSAWAQLKLRARFQWSRFLSAVVDGARDYYPWKARLHRIDGKFGSATGSYFSLIRFLLAVNLVNGLLLFGLVFTPSVIESPFYDNLNVQHSGFGGTVLGRALSAGTWEDTPLFYGSYSPKPLDSGYDLPLAYFLAVCATWTISLVVIVVGMARKLEQNESYIDSRIHCLFANKVFVSYDYGVYNPDATRQMQLSNSRELRTMLFHELKQQLGKRPGASAGALVGRLLVSFGFLLCTAASAFAIREMHARLSDDASTDFFEALATPFTISVMNVIVPGFFAKISVFELWGDSTFQLSVTVLRSAVFRVTVLATYFASFLRDHDSGTELCWETRVGQEIYRLVLYSFLISILTSLGQVSWDLLYRCGAAPFPATFSVAENVLSLIYLQVLLWFGTLMSPVLPMIGSLVLFCLFHLKSAWLLGLAEVPHSIHRFDWGHAFYLKMLLAAYLVAVVPAAWVIVEQRPGQCGPFSDQNTIQDIIKQTTRGLPDGAIDAVQFIGTPGFVIPFGALVAALAYTLRFMAFAKRQAVTELKHRLLVEREDTRHLLRQRHIKL